MLYGYYHGYMFDENVSESKQNPRSENKTLVHLLLPESWWASYTDFVRVNSQNWVKHTTFKKMLRGNISMRNI